MNVQMRSIHYTLPHGSFFFTLIIYALTTNGATIIDVGAPTPSHVPAWNAAGSGPLPWQGISTIDFTRDGKYIAVGTMAPLDDPNVFILDAQGKIVEQREVGIRWISELAAFESGPAFAAISPMATGEVGDYASLFR